MAQIGGALKFNGHQHLRQRLVLSILSGKNVRIDKIRTEDKNPGLRGAVWQSCVKATHCLEYRFRDQSLAVIREGDQWDYH